MNKTLLILSLFLAFSFSACTNSDGDDTPVINVLGVFLNDGDTNYARQWDALPVLTRRDTLDVIMKLDGKGADLKSFQGSLLNDEQGSLIKIILEEANSEDISDDPNFTNRDEYRLGFVDGVATSEITARICIRTTQEEEIDLGFYLFVKENTSQGDPLKLLLQTGERIEEEEPQSTETNE